MTNNNNVYNSNNSIETLTKAFSFIDKCKVSLADCFEVRVKVELEHIIFVHATFHENESA